MGEMRGRYEVKAQLPNDEEADWTNWNRLKRRHLQHLITGYRIPVIEVDGDFYAPTSFSLISRTGERTRFDTPHEGRGLRHQADEVARCLRQGLLESSLMPLDESVSIMETMDAVLAQKRG